MKFLILVAICLLAVSSVVPKQEAQANPNAEAAIAALTAQIQMESAAEARNIQNLRNSAAASIARLDLSTQVGRWDAEILNSQLAFNIGETQRMHTGNIVNINSQIEDIRNGGSVPQPPATTPPNVSPTPPTTPPTPAYLDPQYDDPPVRPIVNTNPGVINNYQSPPIRGGGSPGGNNAGSAGSGSSNGSGWRTQ